MTGSMTAPKDAAGVRTDTRVDRTGPIVDRLRGRRAAQRHPGPGPQP